MSTRQILFSKLGINVLVVFSVLCASCFLNACGASSDDGATSDDPGTSEEAEDGANAALETTMLVLSTVLSGEEGSLNAPAGLVRAGPTVREMTVTETDECDGIAAGTPSGGTSFTIYGTDFSTGGSGYCTISTEGLPDAGDDASVTRLSCSDFNAAEAFNYVSLDGSLGLALSTYENSADRVRIMVTVGTNDLLMGFLQDGSTKLCEIKMYITETATINVYESSIESTTEYDGCISVCDAPFELSGEDTESYYF